MEDSAAIKASSVPAMQASAPVGDGSRMVDALVTWPGGRLAVEADGPTHFIPSPDGVGTVKSTATRLRDHQLAEWDVPVLPVKVAGKPVRYFASSDFQAELAEQLRSAGVPLKAAGHARGLDGDGALPGYP